MRISLSVRERVEHFSLVCSRTYMHKVRCIHVWDEVELYDVKSIDGKNFRPDGKSDRVSFVTVTRQHLRSTPVVHHHHHHHYQAPTTTTTKIRRSACLNKKKCSHSLPLLLLLPLRPITLTCHRHSPHEAQTSMECVATSFSNPHPLLLLLSPTTI